MIVPSGVNQLEFYKKCVEKGIKIQSHFEGVSFFLAHGRRPSWRVQFQKDKVYVYLGIFPLTEKGEEAAGSVYKEFADNYKNLSKEEKEIVYNKLKLHYKSTSKRTDKKKNKKNKD